jgi:TfoX/Sxy family transcriptional regulator of competence genes
MPEGRKSAPVPKWRPPPAELVDLFDKIAQSFPESEMRKMFGFPCCFVNGNMCAGLHQENFILRLSEKDREEFLHLKGAKPFEPMPGRVMSEYVVVPQDILRSEVRLGAWFMKASAYARSLPPKKKKVKRNSRK